MKKLKELYQQSLQELCHTKTVVLCGLLAALAIVLSMVASIQLGPYIKIGFSGLPNRIVEFLFGPAVGCLFGGALDLLKYVLKPDGPFFFGFTFNAMLSGLIYGKGFIALLGPRVIKNVIMLPIDSFILFFALTYAKKIAAQFGFFTVKSGAKERA